MVVYELRHTTYTWEDSDTNVYTMMFETKEDAMTYLTEKKYDIVKEYCDQLGIPNDIDQLRTYTMQSVGYDEFDDLPDYFNIWIDEYGSDTLSIIQQQVLRFN